MKIENVKQLDNLISDSVRHITVLYFDSILCHSCIPQITLLNSYLKNNNNIIFKIIDIDESNEIVEKLDITSIPLVQIYKNKQKYKEFYGNDICRSIIKKTIDYLL